MHKVKCYYCGIEFDRDKHPFVKISSRRYAHQQCAEDHEANLTKEERDLEALEKYIKQLFNETCINARIRKQIKEYQEEYQYTYSGILKTLIYWYEVRGNSIEKSNGAIGIVPYVYDQAWKYYHDLWIAKKANEEKNINEYKPKVVEIIATPPKVSPKKVKLLFEDEVM